MTKEKLAELARLAEAAHEKDQSPTNEWYKYSPLAFVHFQNASNPQAVLGLIARIDELSARCAKLEAALEFYADVNNWNKADELDEDLQCIDGDDLEKINGDYRYRGGRKAREALTTNVDENRSES